jgi:hypothetical protein
MASTIWVDESKVEVERGLRGGECNSHDLPTRLSTKLTLRSLWRIRAGGHPDRETTLPEVRLGFCRSSRGTSTEACDACLVHETAGPGWSQDASARWELKHAAPYCSDESEVRTEMEVSSECCEQASDQTEAEEDDAVEASEEA